MKDEQSADDSDERPKISKTVTAWIGGATAIVAALGGLSGAFNNFRFANSAQTQDAAAAQNVAEPAGGTSADQPQEPTSYTTGDSGSFKLVDGMWLWTTKDGVEYRYKVLSNDGTTTVAELVGGEDGKDVYLRWPNAGGQALQSFDDQETWIKPIELQPDS